MPNLSPLRDNAYASGSPTNSTSSGSSSLLVTATIEPFIQEVLDTTTIPAPVGKLLVFVYSLANNKGGAQYIQSTTATEARGLFEYGIVTKSAAVAATSPAFPGGDLNLGKAQITQVGITLALCTTTGTAIAAGTPLAADGSGNLTPVASPAAGTVLARAIGTLAGSTSTPTLVLVRVGGY
jgi:hypothetical protein